MKKKLLIRCALGFLLGMAAMVVLRLISQLARAANGYLLGAVFLTVTGFHTAYQYISTLIEYDQREL